MPYLIISRKLHQAFKLVKQLEPGEEEPEVIEISYTGRHGTEIRLGISAALKWKIHRSEEYPDDRKKKVTPRKDR